MSEQTDLERLWQIHHDAVKFFKGIGRPCIEIDAEQVGVITRGGKPVLIMQMDHFIELVQDTLERAASDDD